jgi:hypothetical protein
MPERMLCCSGARRGGPEEEAARAHILKVLSPLFERVCGLRLDLPKDL